MHCFGTLGSKSWLEFGNSMIDILCHRRTALKCKGTSKIIGCPVKLNQFIDLYFAKLLLSINWVYPVLVQFVAVRSFGKLF